MNIQRLLCKLGIHGPVWFGIGPHANGPRNYRIGALHRHCSVCNSEWADYEGIPRAHSRVLIWEKIK